MRWLEPALHHARLAFIDSLTPNRTDPRSLTLSLIAPAISVRASVLNPASSSVIWELIGTAWSVFDQAGLLGRRAWSPLGYRLVSAWLPLGCRLVAAWQFPK